MTAIRVALRRRGRPLAFLAATGFAVVGIASAGSATAGGTPAPPAYGFSTAASAIGIQVALQRQPDFSNLPDPFDAEIPDSEAQLDSFGTSQADGHIANLNGLGGVPGLVCLAAGASTCAAIPIGTITAGVIPTFPPPDPLDAHATYPAAQSAKAPDIGGKAAQASVDTSGLRLNLGTADATAQQYQTSTQVAAQDLGIAAVVSVGSAQTSTSQQATADGLVTTATAYLTDIDLGGKLLSIGSMTTTTTVTSKPGKPATDTTSTVLGDVKAAGLPATIDASGVHIEGKGLPGNVVADVQSLVNKVLGKAGIKLSLASVKRSNGATGHTVAASGLMFTFDHSVSGTTPITVAPPQGLPCPPALANLPLDPCSGVSLSLDGAYHGVIALGQVGVVSMAQPSSSQPVVTPPVGPTSPASLPGGGGPGSGLGGLANPPTGPTVTGGSSPTGPSPVVVGPQRAVADQLNDVSHRLLWFFPLLGVGLLAIIGRLRTPARLPSVGTNS